MVVILDPSMDVPAIVQAAPPGETFELSPGVYRVGNIVLRDRQVLEGRGTAILNGSTLLPRWVADAHTWRATLPLPPLPLTGEMAAGHALGSYREDLFIDDVRLQRVATIAQLGPDAWYFDPAKRQAVIGRDPSGRRVEIGTQPIAITGSARDASIRNITVEKYATAPQIGAIHGYVGVGWTIAGVTVRWNHGSGVNVGAGFTVRGGRVYENGQLGIGGARADGAIVQNVEVYGNNYAGYDPQWESGGIKITDSTGVTLMANYVHHNAGVGLWGDIGMTNTRYIGNVVVENTESGILHEISYHALIQGNIVLRNGQSGRLLLTPAQIVVQNSRNVEVADNFVEVGQRVGNGITLVYADRGSGPNGPYETRSNVIARNTVVHLDDGGTDGFLTDFDVDRALGWSNLWRGNRYIVPSEGGTHWTCDNALCDWRRASGRWQADGTLVIEHRARTPDPGLSGVRDGVPAPKASGGSAGP